MTSVERRVRPAPSRPNRTTTSVRSPEDTWQPATMARAETAVAARPRTEGIGGVRGTATRGQPQSANPSDSPAFSAGSTLRCHRCLTATQRAR